MQLLILVISMASFGSVCAACFKLVGWRRSPLVLGWLTGVFLSSIYLPWLSLKSQDSALIFCVVSVSCSLFVRRIWRSDRIDTSPRKPGVPLFHQGIWAQMAMPLGAFAVAVPYVLFLIYSHYQVPTFAWDTLWYWAPLAIDLSNGGALPQSGHPSFGAYGLAYFSKMPNVPANGLLLVVQATCGAVSVSLLTRGGNIFTKNLLGLYLCLSMPMFFQVYFNIGYFDVHVATCLLVSLIILIDLRHQANSSASFFGALLIALLLSTALLLKTTALIPVTCFLCVALVAFLKRRTFLLISAVIALVILCYFNRGFYFSILGREFSLDWDRNPVMIVPGLWGEVLHDASVGDVLNNFLAAFFVNQSYSLVFLALFFVLFFRTLKRENGGDPRLLMSFSLVFVELVLQTTVPYFYDHAAVDTRFTRSMLIVPLISIALFVDEVLCIERVSNKTIDQAQKFKERAA